MKILKKILIAILIIIALFLIVAIFLPNKYKVERTTKIDKPVEFIYGYLSDFNNFRDWNPWTNLEPGHDYNVNGDSATVGQKYSWQGKVIGKGEMIFTDFKPFEKIKSNIKFITPQEGKGLVEWNFKKENENTTNVSWSLEGDAEYPMGRYFSLMMDSFLGKSFQDGLNNLKEKCEKK